MRWNYSRRRAAPWRGTTSSSTSRSRHGREHANPSPCRAERARRSPPLGSTALFRERPHVGERMAFAERFRKATFCVVDSSSLPVDSSFAGAYRIVRVLAEAEASTVYAAEALSTGALRALEVLKPPTPFGAIESARFLNETARATLLFESAHVPVVLDAGVEAGSPWQVTELLVGETLDAAIARDGALGIRAAMALLGQVAH